MQLKIDASVRFPGEKRFRALCRKYGWAGPRQSFVKCLNAHMASEKVGAALVVSEMPAGVENQRELLELPAESAFPLVVVPRIDLSMGSGARDVYRYARLGLLGVKLSSLGEHLDPMAPVKLSVIESLPVWKACKNCKIVLFVRPTVRDVQLLPYLIAAFPDVMVVVESSMITLAPSLATIDSWGRPRLNLPLPTMDRFSLWGLANFPNVNVVLSSQYSFSKCEWPYPDLRGWHGVDNMIALIGAERLLWGSDYPWTCTNPGYSLCARYLAEQADNVTATDLDHLYYRTASALFGLFSEPPKEVHGVP